MESSSTIVNQDEVEQYRINIIKHLREYIECLMITVKTEYPDTYETEHNETMACLQSFDDMASEMMGEFIEPPDKVQELYNYLDSGIARKK